MPIARATALKELGNPATSATRLMKLAQEHPDLATQIAAHPNAYPGLTAWLEEHGTFVTSDADDENADAAPAEADAAAEAEASSPIPPPPAALSPIPAPPAAPSPIPAPPAAPEAAPIVASPWGPAASKAAKPTGAAADSTSPKWLRPALIAAGAIIAVGAVVAAALVVPGLLAASQAGEAASADPIGDYRLGAEISWTSDGVGDLGWSDSGDVPAYLVDALATDDAWVTVWPMEFAGSGRASQTVMLATDPRDGSTLWQTSGGNLKECADGTVDDKIVCIDSTDYSVRVFDPTSGDEVTTGVTGQRAQSVAADGDAIFLADESVDDAGSDHVTYTRTDLAGNDDWTVDTNCESGFAGAGIGDAAWVQADGSRLVVSSSCYGAILDPSDGHELEVADVDEVMSGQWVNGGDGYLHVAGLSLNPEETQVVAYDDANSDGSMLWNVDVPDSSGWMTIRKLGTGDSAPILVADLSSGALTRLDPVAASPRVDSMPKTLPDCPDGWRPVAWSEWDGGATLICEAGDASVTVFLIRGGETQRSSSAAVTPTGYRASFDDADLEFGLGGWVTWVDGKSYVASAGWTTSGGSVEYPEAAKIKNCPAGTFALSLSVWNGGWLLTCGVDAGSVTRFVYLDEAGSGSGDDLTFDAGRYCGTDSDGQQVCVSASPALVEFGAGDDTVQRSVSENFFADAGQGGSGQGTGAYGVDAPDDTAEDQVGYLVAILDLSADARSTVTGVLAPLNACSVTSGNVQALRDLTQARTDLLNALQSTPVDAVPDGTRLLGLLRTALQLSEQADLGYVDAAVQMSGGDCTGGKATYNNAIAVANQAEGAKQAFVDAWNAQISGAFAVRTFTAKDI